jgi:hypothetical protein
VLTQVVDDTAALCAIHADYLNPPTEDLLRGVAVRVVPREPPARQTA